MACVWVCCSFADNVDHYRIQTIDGNLTIDEEVFFKDLDEMIAHYRGDSDGLCHHLVKALPQKGGKEQIDKKKFTTGGWELDAKHLTREQMLGAGQFGEVFEGTYKGTKVAVKTLKEVTDEAVHEFLAEADVMT